MRRHLAGLAVVLAIAGAVTLHHSGLAHADPHHGGLTAVAELCLTALIAVGAAVVAGGMSWIALRPWRPATAPVPAARSIMAAAPQPRARAGPPLVLLFCSLRH